MDVLYSVSARNNPDENEVKWKSILVQVGRDSYKEIFHLQAFYSTVFLEFFTNRPIRQRTHPDNR